MRKRLRSSELAREYLRLAEGLERELAEEGHMVMTDNLEVRAKVREWRLKNLKSHCRRREGVDRDWDVPEWVRYAVGPQRLKGEQKG